MIHPASVVLRARQPVITDAVTNNPVSGCRRSAHQQAKADSLFTTLDLSNRRRMTDASMQCCYFPHSHLPASLSALLPLSHCIFLILPVHWWAPDCGLYEHITLRRFLVSNVFAILKRSGSRNTQLDLQILTVCVATTARHKVFTSRQQLDTSAHKDPNRCANEVQTFPSKRASATFFFQTLEYACLSRSLLERLPLTIARFRSSPMVFQSGFPPSQNFLQTPSLPSKGGKHTWAEDVNLEPFPKSVKTRPLTQEHSGLLKWGEPLGTFRSCPAALTVTFDPIEDSGLNITPRTSCCRIRQQRDGKSRLQKSRRTPLSARPMPFFRQLTNAFTRTVLATFCPDLLFQKVKFVFERGLRLEHFLLIITLLNFIRRVLVLHFPVEIAKASEDALKDRTTIIGCQPLVWPAQFLGRGDPRR